MANYQTVPTRVNAFPVTEANPNLNANVGDYVVVYGDGRIETMNAERFHATFEEIKRRGGGRPRKNRGAADDAGESAEPDTD